MSVTERTGEIGIRLAVGAMETEVLLQCLVEAVALSPCGGLLGIALAMITSYVLAARRAVPCVVDSTMVGVAVLFSSAVGMMCGYCPAREEPRLDPIEALRHE